MQRMRSIAAMLAAWTLWASWAGVAFAQTDPPDTANAAPPTSLLSWIDCSAWTGKRDSVSAPGLLGEGVPPAVLLLDMSMPPGLNGAVPLGESALWAPKASLENQPAYLGMVRQDASVGVSLFSGDNETLIGFVDLRNILFNTNAYLKDSQRPFPNQLWDVTTGVSYSRSNGAGWTVGGGASIGSPSDIPYHSLREMYPSINVFVRTPASREPDGWLMSLSWVPVSLIRFPLPGLAYEWNASEQLQIVAGIPFSIVWRPREDLRLDVGYMPPFQTRAQLTWNATEKCDAFVGFESVTDAYLLADREQRRDFFYSYEKRLPAGVRFHLSDHCVLDLAGGYLFDRIYYSSRTITDESRDRIHVSPAAFGMVRFALTF